MTVLLAVGNPALSGIIRKHLANAEFDVYVEDVLHRKYLDEIIELEKPTMLILHDVYLTSDHVDIKDKDTEMLGLIQKWRTIYDTELRIVYICEREKRDPFISALVAHNVLDIFNDQYIDAEHFVEQLANEARYANVQRFGIGTLEVDFEEEPIASVDELSYEHQVPTKTEPKVSPISQKAEQAKQLLSQLTDKAKAAVETGNEWNEQRQKEKKERTPPAPAMKKEDKPKRTVEKKPGLTNSDFSEILDMMPIPQEVYARTEVIGTVVVAVAGAKPHLGSTHTAMAIASFLQQGRHSVALIELNDSQDFDRIHALYEGEKQFIHQQSSFDYQGIDHYKYRDDLRLGEIMATYEYVVLDIGDIADSSYYDEYIRSHVRVLLVSPYEWKQHWTDAFRKQVPDEDNFIFVTPFAGKENVSDMKERLPHLHIVPFPANLNPYEIKEKEEEAIRVIMQGFIKENKRVFSKKAVLIASVASAITTAIVISAFVLL